MKNLVFLGGPMGVGKTTAARLLLDRLDRAVWLDGDWCWQQGRNWNFGERNREMVVENICCLLTSFLHSEDYDTVLFTWVLHTRQLRDLLLSRLPSDAFRLTDLSLVCDGKTLRRRLRGRGSPTEEAERALERLSHFPVEGTETLDTTGLTPAGVADLVGARLGLPPTEEPLDMAAWLADFTAAVKGAFGQRLRFLGLQGSQARGEARPDSDIDPVVILDRLERQDLDRYRQLIAGLPHGDLVCGFLSGWEELAAWDRGELFSFIMDTRPVIGSLEVLLEQVGEEDLRRAVHTGACGVYHSCVHAVVHSQGEALLPELCKAAFFTMRVQCWLERRQWPGGWEALIALSSGDAREILLGGMALRRGEAVEEDHLFQALLNWSGGLIRRGTGH